MPAAVVRGILISIGIIAALGIAVYENPEVQQWLDEQRRKLATLLRNIGDELDPQSRREAEAFAFGGQATTTPNTTNDETSRDAAVATGRSPTTAGTIRRIPVQGTVDSQEREERQRLGREYLARRNQQMMEMQERRRIQSQAASGSFDSLVDDEGKLKIEPKDETPLLEDAMKSEFFDAAQSTPEETSANPFSDDQMIDRSATPRPPVPPKIKLEHIEPAPEPDVVASSSQQPASTLIDEHRFPVPGSMPGEELSYEDQLALALAISKEESAIPTAHSSHDRYADDLRLATEASLRDTTSGEALSSHLSDVSEEDLYNVTPNLTRARLATFNAQHPALAPMIVSHNPVPEAATFHSTHDDLTRPDEAPGTKTPTEASSFAFESDVDDTISERHSAAPSHTLSEASLIEVEDQASDVISEDGIATPDSWTEVGSHDGDSDVEMREAPMTA